MAKNSSSAVTITYVPADCGSMLPGKSKAPEAFRKVGVVEKLKKAGVQRVAEVEALSSPALYKVSEKGTSGVRNLESNLEVCAQVDLSLSNTLKKSAATDFQLILGGECCMSPAILKSFWNNAEASMPGKRVGFLYIDADTDLYSPLDPSSIGTFAGMNMTHLLNTPGAVNEMSHYVRPNGLPLCDESNTVFFGTNLPLAASNPSHLGYLLDRNYKIVSADSVAQSPVARAQEAIKFLENQVDEILVHLDVDSIDPQMFPLANVPNFTGVTFENMMAALKEILASEKVVALTIAEVNPDHDPDLSLTNRLVDSVVNSLTVKN